MPVDSDSKKKIVYIVVIGVCLAGAVLSYRALSSPSTPPKAAAAAAHADTISEKMGTTPAPHADTVQPAGKAGRSVALPGSK